MEYKSIIICSRLLRDSANLRITYLLVFENYNHELDLTVLVSVTIIVVL